MFCSTFDGCHGSVLFTSLSATCPYDPYALPRPISFLFIHSPSILVPVTLQHECRLLLTHRLGPPFMLVDCSDSRVNEQGIFSAKPGTIFTAGNIANQFDEVDMSS